MQNLRAIYMRAQSQLSIPLLAVVLTTFAPDVSAQNEIRVAVASNFSHAMTVIAGRFEANTGHPVVLSFGSTGKHYAQIVNGAPFDAFFAADAGRPERLEEEGVAVAGSRFTYALGKLVLWSRKKGYVDPDAAVLKRGFHRMAVANPKLAPYGKAAEEILRTLGLWETLSPRIVRGENISQTYQFVYTGNAELGFVAYSQIIRPGQSTAEQIEGSFWEVPQTLYSPIEQQAVLLTDNETVRDFLSYVRSEEVLKIIRDSGYGTPERRTTPSRSERSELK